MIDAFCYPSASMRSRHRSRSALGCVHIVRFPRCNMRAAVTLAPGEVLQVRLGTQSPLGKPASPDCGGCMGALTPQFCAEVAQRIMRNYKSSQPCHRPAKSAANGVYRHG